MAKEEKEPDLIEQLANMREQDLEQYAMGLTPLDLMKILSTMAGIISKHRDKLTLIDGEMFVRGMLH